MQAECYQAEATPSFAFISNAKLMIILTVACFLLLVVANVTIGKTNDCFFIRLLVISNKMCTFAAESDDDAYRDSEKSHP